MNRSKAIAFIFSEAEKELTGEITDKIFDLIKAKVKNLPYQRQVAIGYFALDCALAETKSHLDEYGLMASEDVCLRRFL